MGQLTGMRTVLRLRNRLPSPGDRPLLLCPAGPRACLQRPPSPPLPTGEKSNARPAVSPRETSASPILPPTRLRDVVEPRDGRRRSRRRPVSPRLYHHSGAACPSPLRSGDTTPPVVLSRVGCVQV